MKRFRLTAIMSVIGLALPLSLALAVGSGGGGSNKNTNTATNTVVNTTPSCSQDTWSCTNWSSCSPAGQQTRTCSKTVDCATADTPQPATTQACTPTPTCGSDTWVCSDWGTCSSTGRQERTCRMTANCATATTPSPITEQACTPNINAVINAVGNINTETTANTNVVSRYCYERATLRERVDCRLRLPAEDYNQEIANYYLPEECRFFDAGDIQRQQCIDQYKAYEPCWSEPVGDQRTGCAASVLALPADLTAARIACGTDVPCLTELRSKTYNLIKFRMYDLEERAETLIGNGATIESVTDLSVTIQEAKNTFNQATTTAARRQVILDVRAAWQAFLSTLSS